MKISFCGRNVSRVTVRKAVLQCRKTKRPPGEEDPVGVVGFDWRLGGGVSSVISERAGRRSAQLRIHVITFVKGLTASGVGCQIHLNFVQPNCFVDVRFIDRLSSFLQRNMNMAAMI
jgi:hypothetical protein